MGVATQDAVTPVAAVALYRTCHRHIRRITGLDDCDVPRPWRPKALGWSPIRHRL